MFKNIFAMTLFALLLAVSSKAAHAASAPLLDKSFLDKGLIAIQYPGNNEVKGIVRIMKDSVQYDCQLVNGAHYPLQLGNGTYHIVVAEFVSNNQYKMVMQDTVDLHLDNGNVVFVQSIPLIDWNIDTKAVVETDRLINDGMTDSDKVAAIYDYITRTIKYDNEKARTVTADYLPDLNKVYDTSSGICYDYAALFAAMARSMNIPTRLVMGYEASAPETYHAWNQAYLANSNTWVTIDTTYDAGRVQAGQDVPMMKDPMNYTITQVY